MDEQDSKSSESSAAERSGEPASPGDSKEERKRLRLTPEHRRFLGPAYRQQSTTEQKSSKAMPAARVQRASSSSARVPDQKTPRRAGAWKASAPVEMEKIVLLLGALMLLCGAFYVGKKYESWKNRLATRKDAQFVYKETSEVAGA